jgi:hypothetical protein
LDGDHRCRGCDGTGWAPYRKETEDGGFEGAYRLCPEGHAPRYCVGSGGGHPCPRPATRRRGSSYYCEEHVAAVHDGGDLDDRPPCPLREVFEAHRDELLQGAFA